MARHISLSMLLALCVMTGEAQQDTTWLRRWAGSGTTYQEDWARDIAVDELGNVFVTGICNAGGTGGTYVTLKYSPGGKLRWERLYSGGAYNEAHALVVDPFNNVWVTGESGGNSTRDVYTVAYGPEGNIVWSGRFDFGTTDVGYAIDCSDSGDVAVTGYSNSIGAPVLFHGRTGWSKQVPGLAGQAIVVTDSSVTVAGTEGTQYGIARFNLAGDILWHVKSGNQRAGYVTKVYSLAVDRFGNSYVTGTTGDMYTVSFNSAGTERWSAKDSGASSTGGYEVTLDSKDNVIVAGWKIVALGPPRIIRGVLTKFTSAGTLLWSRTLDLGGIDEQFRAVAVGRGDTIYVAGSQYASSYVDADYYMAAFSPDGDLFWWNTYAGNGAAYSTASAIATDTSGGLYVTGWSSQNNEWPDNADIVTMKFWGKPLFRPNPDGWVMENSETDMWPPDWYSQFKYSLPPYPAIFSEWPISADSSDFPDWPLFVETFGEDQCLFPGSTPAFYSCRLSAVISWRSIVSEWGGSCFGFSTSSLLFFNDFLSFEEMFPADETVFSVPLTSFSRRLVNRYQLYQYAGNLLAKYRPLYAKTPRETARELITMISDDAHNKKSLSVLNNAGAGGHEVVPCKVVEHPGNANLVDVKIYDSNYPGTEQVIMIDTVENIWAYDKLPGWGGQRSIMLGLDISTYAARPGLPKRGIATAQAQPTLGPDSASMILYVTSGAGCLITDSSGGTLGFDPSDSSVTATMADAFPIIPRTGSFSPPIGYFLPAKPCDVLVSSPPDTSLYVRAIGHSVIAAYEEHGAVQGEEIVLHLSGAGDGFLVRNPESRARTGMLRSILMDPTREMATDFADLVLPAHDSLAIATAAANSVRIDGGGSPSRYTLSLSLGAPYTALSFRHRDVALAAGSSHLVAPDWDRLDVDPVRVFVDADRDGTPDDTLILANEITDVSYPRGGADVPGSFVLEQNYPNPFNAVTTVRFGLPQKSGVRLTVYNLLGQVVATLAHGEWETGYHEVRFDASDLPSGIYLYRLVSGDFAATKKAILVK